MKIFLVLLCFLISVMIGTVFLSCIIFPLEEPVELGCEYEQVVEGE